MPVIVEQATLEDAREILDLQKLAYLSEAAIYDVYDIPPLTQTVDEMRADMREQLVLKATDGDRIVGSVRAYLREGTCFIGRLIVHPESQNRGLGTRLLAEIESRFGQAQRFELFTGHKSERNLHLYCKAGYRPFKQVPAADALTIVFLEKGENRMQNHGRTSVYEFLGDRIVYRNLVPADPRLPPLAEIRPQVGLKEGVIPRKSAPEYARVIVHLLRRARALDAPGVPVERLLYVGDTHLNDGNAFANVCRAGDWPGLAFIGSERDAPAQVEIVEEKAGALYLANRWSALAEFDRFCRERDFSIDERTAIVVDLDKTALGARGRNDHVIDRARVEAVRRTVGDLLGDEFDPASFQAAYDRLNQPQFHPFTSDNQDYLAYICLILGSGLLGLDPLVDDVQAGRMASFQQFIAGVDARAADLSADLREIHRGIYDCVRQGDPTPFKAFRYNEYRVTVGRMGHLDDDSAVNHLLADEILITQEVRRAALAWRGRGALLFGLSDKPDEASIPTEASVGAEALSSGSYQPIHRAETHAVGG